MKIEKSSQDLQIEVWATAQCMHCGACGAFCPHIEYRVDGAPRLVDQCWENVGLCYNSCPRTHLDFADLDYRTFGKLRENEAIGVFEKIVLAQSNDGGEIIGVLAKTALNEGVVHLMVMPQAPFKGKGANMPVIVKDVGEVDANIPKNGTNCAGPLITGIGQAFQKEENTRIGFVGNPCHLQAIKNTAHSDFCTGADYTKFSIAVMCPAGGMGACKFCIDLAGEFADISVGSKPQGAPEGWNILVIRSAIGAEVLEKSIAAGLITIDENVDIAKLEDAATKKKRKNLDTRMAGKKVDVVGYYLTPGQLKFYFN